MLVKYNIEFLAVVAVHITSQYRMRNLIDLKLEDNETVQVEERLYRFRLNLMLRAD